MIYDNQDRFSGQFSPDTFENQPNPSDNHSHILQQVLTPDMKLDGDENQRASEKAAFNSTNYTASNTRAMESK
jgi:hypothetical protein